MTTRCSKEEKLHASNSTVLNLNANLLTKFKRLYDEDEAKIEKLNASILGLQENVEKTKDSLRKEAKKRAHTQKLYELEAKENDNNASKVRNCKDVIPGLKVS